MAGLDPATPSKTVRGEPVPQWLSWDGRVKPGHDEPVDPALTRGKRILLFDDLFRSGATMNAITAALYDQGDAADVFALTVTRTRSLQ